jgi:hypothetical protein
MSSWDDFNEQVKFHSDEADKAITEAIFGKSKPDVHLWLGTEEPCAKGFYHWTSARMAIRVFRVANVVSITLGAGALDDMDALKDFLAAAPDVGRHLYMSKRCSEEKSKLEACWESMRQYAEKVRPVRFTRVKNISCL